MQSSYLLCAACIDDHIHGMIFFKSLRWQDKLNTLSYSSDTHVASLPFYLLQFLLAFVSFADVCLILYGFGLHVHMYSYDCRPCSIVYGFGLHVHCIAMTVDHAQYCMALAYMYICIAMTVLSIYLFWLFTTDPIITSMISCCNLISRVHIFYSH